LEVLARNWLSPSSLKDTFIWSVFYHGKINGEKVNDLELKVRKGESDYSNPSDLVNLFRVLFSVNRQVHHSLLFERDVPGQTFDLTYKQPDQKDPSRDNMFKIAKAPTEEKLLAIKSKLINFFVPYFQAAITFYEKPTTLLYVDMIFEKFSDEGLFDLTEIVNELNFGIAVPIFQRNEHSGDLEFQRFMSVTNVNAKGRQLVNKKLKELSQEISKFASDFVFYFDAVRSAFQSTATIWQIAEGQDNDLNDANDLLLSQNNLLDLGSMVQENFQNGTGSDFLVELAYELRDALGDRHTRRMVKDAHFVCFQDETTCMLQWCDNVVRYVSSVGLEDVEPICKEYKVLNAAAESENQLYDYDLDYPNDQAEISWNFDPYF